MNSQFWLILNKEHHSQDAVQLVWFSLFFFFISTFFMMILHLAENSISFAFTSFPWKLWLKQNNSMKDLACRTKIPPICLYLITVVDPNNHSYSEHFNPIIYKNYFYYKDISEK